MIYKVYYQENQIDVPVREKTQTLYVEAGSVREVRKMLEDRPFNIEYIQELDGAYLQYEKNSENFKLHGND